MDRRESYSTETALYRAVGRVQGVGYRAFARSVAVSNDLTGAACNCADGSVRVLLCGSSSQIAAAVEQLRSGPPASDVQGVRSEGAAPRIAIPNMFEILNEAEFSLRYGGPEKG